MVLRQSVFTLVPSNGEKGLKLITPGFFSTALQRCHTCNSKHQTHGVTHGWVGNLEFELDIMGI